MDVQLATPSQTPLIEPQILARIVEECVLRVLDHHNAIKPPLVIETTLADFADYNLYGSGIRQSTSKSYLSDLRSFEKFIFNTFQRVALTSDLTPKMLREFVADRRKAEIAETTLERQVQGIITYSEFLHDQGLVDSPLTLRKAKLRFKKRFKGQPRISIDAFKILMQTDFKTTDPLILRNWTLFNFLAHTDIAITATLRLKRSDIDLTTKKVSVRNRSIDLPSHLVDLLAKHVREADQPDAPLFPSRSGRHICPSNYRKLIFTPSINRIAPTYKFRSCHPRDLPKEIREKLLAIPTL